MNCIESVLGKISEYFSITTSSSKNICFGVKHFIANGLDVVIHVPIWSLLLPTSLCLCTSSRTKVIFNSSEFIQHVGSVEHANKQFALLCFGIGNDFYETTDTWRHAVVMLRSDIGEMEVFDPIVYDEIDFGLKLRSDIKNLILKNKSLIAAIITSR